MKNGKLISEMNKQELEVEIMRLQYYVNSNIERGNIKRANDLKDKIKYAKQILSQKQ